MSLAIPRRLAPLIAVACTLFAAQAQAGDLAVEAAWIRLPPPGANTAGYMTLVNRGEAKITITGVSAEGVERLELHETVIEDDVARMRRIDALDVPAGGRVVLAPRGLHLMLIRPGTLSEERAIELVFELAGGGELRVAVPVRRSAPGG